MKRNLLHPSAGTDALSRLDKGESRVSFSMIDVHDVRQQCCAAPAKTCESASPCPRSSCVLLFLQESESSDNLKKLMDEKGNQARLRQQELEKAKRVCSSHSPALHHLNWSLRTRLRGAT